MAEAARAVTLDDIQTDEAVLAYMETADDYLGGIGYTEHGFRHGNLVAHIAGNVLRRLAYDDRVAEVAAIAGFMHDIGNCIGRDMHGVASALISKSILEKHGMAAKEIALVMNAMGSHEEEFGSATNPVAAAVIIADKSDVHHTRVRATDPAQFDIHDRVNYAAKRSFLRVDSDTRLITLEVDIDTESVQVMEYFEIFLSRMQMCRQAARVLDAEFSLVINGSRLL